MATLKGMPIDWQTFMNSGSLVFSPHSITETPILFMSYPKLLNAKPSKKLSEDPGRLSENSERTTTRLSNQRRSAMKSVPVSVFPLL